MAAPNGTPGRALTAANLEQLRRFIPPELRDQPVEAQMNYMQRALATNTAQRAAAQAQRQNMAQSQAFQGVANGIQVRSNSPNISNMPQMQQGVTPSIGSPASALRVRPMQAPPPGQQVNGQMQITPQMQMRPPLQQQVQPGMPPGSPQQPNNLAPRQLTAQEVAQAQQAQFLQEQQRMAQAKVAAAIGNIQQTPTPRPAALPQQGIQGSPSGSMGSPMMQMHPLQAQAQAMLNKVQGQGQIQIPMQSNGGGPGMARPPMRSQGPGPNNAGVRLGNGGQGQGQAQVPGQGQNSNQAGQPMGNMGQRGPLMGTPAGAGQAEGGVQDKLRLNQVFRDPAKLTMWLRVFDKLEYYQERKRANQLTQEEARALEEVTSGGPEFFSKLRALSTMTAQSAQNQMPMQPGQHRGPLLGPNQLPPQQMAALQNFARPPLQVNGQASVLANRSAMQQGGVPQMPQMGNMQGQAQMNQAGLPNGAAPMDQTGGQPVQGLSIVDNMELVFEKMNTLPEAKRAEHLQSHKPIRASYFNHIRQNLRPEQQSALFERLPDVSQLYHAYQRELAQNRAAALLAGNAQGAGFQGQPGQGFVHTMPQMGNNAMSHAITANPVPNLHMPSGRQRLSGSGQGQGGAVQQMQSPSFAAAGLQMAQNMTSPGGSAQGTPSFRAAALANTMGRAGTPSRMNPMGQRGSPTVSHAGSPRIPDADAIAAVQAAAQSSVNDLAAGSQQFASGQRGQIQLQGQRSNGMPSVPGPSAPPTANVSARSSNFPGAPRTPFQPTGQSADQIVAISETVADSARRPPSPKPFPGEQAQRATMTSGLAGMGLVLHTPVLSLRPQSFDRIEHGLAIAMGKPGYKAKPSRGALFDRPNSNGREEKDSIGEDDVVAAADSVEEVEMGVEDPAVEEPFVLMDYRKRKISEIAAGVQKNLMVTEGVAIFMRELVDEFTDSIIDAAARLAKHRKVDRLETRDVQYHLEREYGMFIPGFESDTLRVDQVKSKLELTKAVGTGMDMASALAGSKAGNALSVSRAARLAAVVQAKQSAAAAASKEAKITTV